MEINASIKVTVDYELDNWTPKQFHFEWEGPEDGILGISRELMMGADKAVLVRPDQPKIGDTVIFGPYKLTIIDYQTSGNAIEPTGIYYCQKQ